MLDRVFKRKIYKKLLKWKQESNGTSALLLEGARRIGKSTIVEEFAKNEYESFILVDFNKASKETKALFDDLTDLNYIFLSLQATYSTTLIPRKSVIVFDEVQQCPPARQAIKYLVQDGRYDYIETGSLISINKNVENITLPSEEDSIQMHPMDYEEFLWALGDNESFSLMEKFWEIKRPFGAALRPMLRNFRLYMLVGGMPQAVNTYLDTKDLRKVDAIKRKIIKLYADDFRKLDNSGRLGKLFLSVPSQLSRNISRFQPKTVLGNTTPNKMLDMLFKLEDSKTVNIAFHSNDLNVGMELTKDESKYKLYIGDTGLFVTMVFWDKSFTENVIYQKLLSDKLPTNLGYVYENLIAQMLVANGNKLFYYTFPSDDKHYYEIDFLLSRENKICPIVVKSSGYKTHTSLDVFTTKFSNRIARRYLIYTKDLCKDTDIVMLPMFMTSFLNSDDTKNE